MKGGARKLQKASPPDTHVTHVTPRSGACRESLAMPGNGPHEGKGRKAQLQASTERRPTTKSQSCSRIHKIPDGLLNENLRVGSLPEMHEDAEMNILKARLKQAAVVLQPAIFRRRTREAELLQELGIRVLDWQDLKQTSSQRYLVSATSYRSQPRLNARAMSDHMPHSSMGGGSGLAVSRVPKIAKVNKSKNNSNGRTYTSRFRGVHQTFPTKRWEAQFRRNGKPTSLGCFDQEEEAAKAYDKMMLWCEIHNAAGVKGGITNFESSEYEQEIPWLQQCSQDELIETLRSEGRRQAAHRMLKQKRDVTHGNTDDDGPSGSAAD